MILMKGGIIIDPKDGVKKADLLIQDGRILRIAEDILDEEIEIFKRDKEEVEIIDVAGKKIGPGLVDAHVHFRDPGFTYKEDIETGAKAAARGGVTSVILMANTKPTVDNVETLGYVLEKGKQTDIRVHSCASITYGLKGEEMTDMEALLKAGAVGFTDDGIPILSEDLVKKALEKSAALGVPMSFHEENPEFIISNGINAGEASKHFGIGGSDRQAEISMVRRDLEIALATGGIFDVQHISAKESVELVRIAKAKQREAGVPVTIHAEATPHHFSLTEEAAIQHGTMAKMNPPLRCEKDRLAIIEGLVDGTIDMIATDHAPHSLEEKEKDVTQAPSGIIGLETSFALAITNLVRPGHLTLPQLFDRMALAPANLYHLPYGRVQEGMAADLIVFEEDKQQTFDTFVSKSQNSPFKGETLYGRIDMTICDGKVIYQNET